MEALSSFVTDFLEFKEYNDVDNIYTTIKTQQHHHETEAKHFSNPDAIAKFRDDMFHMSVNISSQFHNQTIWRPDRLNLIRIQKMFTDA